MNKSFTLYFVSLFSFFVFFTGCERTEVDAIQEAQLCLNSASTSTAKSCVTAISSINTPQANSLKCASIFISEGFGSPTAFVNALDQINQTGGCGGNGCSSVVNSLTTFAFSTSDVLTGPGRDANNQTAADAFSVCSKSGVGAYTQISSLFKIGTLTSMIAYAATGGAITIDDIDAALTTLIGSNPEAVGELVITTYSAVCTDTTDASDPTKKYCGELQTALNSGSTTTVIGTCLLNKLANPAHVCP